MIILSKIPLLFSHDNFEQDRGSDSQILLPRFLSYQLFRRQNKQHCRDNTTKSFLVLGKISLFFHVFFSSIASNLICEGPQEQVREGKCSEWSHLYTTYEEKYDLK